VLYRKSYLSLLAVSLLLSSMPIKSNDLNQLTVVACGGIILLGIVDIYQNNQIKQIEAQVATLKKENTTVRNIATKPEIQKMVDITNDPRFNDALTIFPQLKKIWDIVNTPAFTQNVATINNPEVRKAIGDFVVAQTSLNALLSDPKKVTSQTLIPAFSLFVERFKDLVHQHEQFERRIEKQMDKLEKRVDSAVTTTNSFADKLQAVRNDIDALKQDQKRQDEALATAQTKMNSRITSINSDAAAINTALTKVAESSDNRLKKLEAQSLSTTAPQPSAPPAYEAA